MPKGGFVLGTILLAGVIAGVVSCSTPSGTAPGAAPPGGRALASQPHTAYAARAVAAGGMVMSVDPVGLPRLIWATSRQAAAKASSPEAAARQHFAHFAPAYGIEGDAVGRVSVETVSRIPHGEVLARLRQNLDGIEVYRGEVKVVMRPDLSLVALAGTPSPVTGAKPQHRRFLITSGEALAKALEHLYGVAVPAASAGPARAAQPSYDWLDLPAGASVRLSEPARAKRVFYRVGDHLVAAYFIEFYSSRGQTTSSDAYRYLVAADDGRVLERYNLTADVAFQYRVFAETTGDRRPLDGPIADYTPHPAGIPDGSDPAFVAPALVEMESFKTLPEGQVDPWLGSAAIQTSGNNVDAYADLFAPDGYSNGDLRATATATGIFDRVYDTAAEPLSSATQVMAATTNLFYLVNWFHDYWYDSGFDEAAGNAQSNNFGRGGAGSDPIRAESQDSGGINNANMSTPSDGLPPRMQMFLWQPPESSTLTITPGPVILDHGTAAFGPQSFDVTADVVLAVDGTPPTSDGCEPITNNVTGKILLVDRGTCSFAIKALSAQNAGAVGLLIANNVAGPPPGLGNTSPPTVTTTPTLSVSLADGTNLKTLLGTGAVTAHMLRVVFPPGRDGSIDNQIVAHEWGHYFHHRLSDCTNYQCAASSEGWGDFNALMMTLREGDNLDGTYGAGIYAPRVFGDTGYFGIRRFPYSVDFTKNALTFKHVQNAQALPTTPQNPIGAPNAEVHNAGEVWASMLFEAYVAVQKNRGTATFADARRKFANIVVLGLQLAPVDATYTDYRNAILAATVMISPDDMQVVAAAFARRGAGTCAVAPPEPDDPNAPDLAPVTESFDVKPLIRVASIQLDDSVTSCDNDGILDAGETGQVQVQVANDGPAAMTGTTVTLATTTSGVTFPDGTSAPLADVAAFGTQTATLKIALANTVTDIGILDLTVTVGNGAACVTSVAEVRTPRIQADERAGSSKTEDVEATSPPWDKTGTGADNVWSRGEVDPTTHVWQGIDSGSPSDTHLVSPPLQVSASGDFQIAFDHAFQFEFSQAPDTYWDGGVIEVTDDDGETWQDISIFADPGYNAPAITDQAGNPLAGRAAFGNQNASYPASDPVSLNLGTMLAGKTVRIRFRIASDEATGANGWTIDNIAFQGIDNTPFTSVVANSGACQAPPVANAGPDQTVASGAAVILTASGSTDPNNDPLNYQWTQTGGTSVTMLNPTTVNPSFQAPVVSANSDLTFQVEVRDALGSSTDSVKVTVLADDGGGCGVAGGGGHGLLVVMLAGLILVVRRRRR